MAKGPSERESLASQICGKENRQPQAALWLKVQWSLGGPVEGVEYASRVLGVLQFLEVNADIV